MKIMYSCVSFAIVLVLFVGSDCLAQGNDQDFRNIEPHVATANHLAEEAINNEAERSKRIKEPEIPVLILEGDSWFNLPFHEDVSDKLEDLGYAVISGASYGDTLENMAFNGQLEQVVAQLRTLARNRKIPKALLLSMGGNDIIGPNLALILNHRNSSLGKTSPFMQNILDGTFEKFNSYALDYIAAVSIMCHRFYQRDEIRRLLDGIDDVHSGRMPIIVHGYDYPVPSGRGFKILWYLTVAGPWLKPSFDMKNFSEEQTTNIVKYLVNKHNDVLRASAEYLHSAGDDIIINPVCYLNLRHTVGEDRWTDELHPNADAMKDIAQKFKDKIETCTHL